MAKIPAPKKVAKAPAKKVAAKPMKDTKKKVDLAPGVSPWERNAIKKGQKKMTHNQSRLHEEFVKGKRDSRRIAREGGYISGWSKSVLKQDWKQTTPKQRYTLDGSLSANATQGAYELGRSIQDNRTNRNRGTSPGGPTTIKELKGKKKTTTPVYKRKVMPTKKGK